MVSVEGPVKLSFILLILTSIGTAIIKKDMSIIYTVFYGGAIVVSIGVAFNIFLETNCNKTNRKEIVAAKKTISNNNKLLTKQYSLPTDNTWKKIVNEYKIKFIAISVYIVACLYCNNFIYNFIKTKLSFLAYYPHWIQYVVFLLPVLFFIYDIVQDIGWKISKYYWMCDDIIVMQKRDMFLNEYKNNPDNITIKLLDRKADDSIIEEYVNTDALKNVDIRENYEYKGTVYKKAYIFSYDPLSHNWKKYSVNKTFLIP